MFVGHVGRECKVWKENTMSDEGEVEDGTTNGTGLAGRIVRTEREPIVIDGAALH